MSKPLISDGPYNISNVASSDLFVELYDASTFGVINARTFHSGGNVQWIVTNIGSGGNRIILESGSNPGTYASTYSETSGSGIVGSTNPTIWTVVSTGKSNYVLATPDGKLGWCLGGSGNGVAIVIDSTPVSSAPPAAGQWAFTYAPWG